jgi:hypothetical protein
MKADLCGKNSSAKSAFQTIVMRAKPIYLGRASNCPDLSNVTKSLYSEKVQESDKPQYIVAVEK